MRLVPEAQHTPGSDFSIRTLAQPEDIPNGQFLTVRRRIEIYHGH